MSRSDAAIESATDARKNPIAGDAVWALLSGQETVHIAVGRSMKSFHPDESSKEEVLARATGRSGNLRAPAVRIGGDLYVGFNDQLYDLIGSRL